MPLGTAEYGALTLDTSIFDGAGLALEAGLLRQLSQFRQGPFRVVISEIVDREVRRHLIEKIKDARASIEKAMRASGTHLLTDKEKLNKARELISGSGSDETVADHRLATFYSRVGVEVIPVEGSVDVARLVEMYFASIPPFEPVSNKKNEFPDALALLSLQSFADREGIKILAASSDKGWGSFALASKHVDVVEKLADAIAAFQLHNDAIAGVIAEIQAVLKAGEGELAASMEAAFEQAVESGSITVEASSDFYYEADDVHAIYKGYTVVPDENGRAGVTLIRMDEDSIVLQLSAEVNCEASASFSLAVWDSIDNEYVGLGSHEASVDMLFDTDLLITLTGNIEGGLASLTVDDVEVTEALNYANFGEIYPDWSDDE